MGVGLKLWSNARDVNIEIIQTFTNAVDRLQELICALLGYLWLSYLITLE